MMGWGHSLTIEKKAEFKENFSNALYLCSYDFKTLFHLITE